MISSISGMGGGFSPPSPAQIREKMFNTIDKSGNGTIDKDEISKLLANSSNSTGNSSSVDNIMKLLDSDQNGSISQVEFDDVMEQMDPRNNGVTGAKKDDHNSTMKTLLDALDNSNSGASDIKQKLFSEADANGDGTISEEEFTQMHANGPANGPNAADIFSKIDTDQSGTISKTESDSFIDKMGPRGGNQRPEGPPPPPPSGQFDPNSYDSNSYDSGSNTDDDSMSLTIKALLDLAKHSYQNTSSTSNSNDVESLLFSSSWSA